MAMLLADMKVGMTDKVAQQVVDIFLRESQILQLLPFDNTVSPSGGSTLTYSYVQKAIPATAAFRELNTEYTANEATTIKRSADLKIMGGKFAMDRVLKQAEGRFNNMAYQVAEHIKAVVSLFHYTLINGDATTDEKEFDGLDKMLAGTTSEFNPADSIIDISTMDSLKSNADRLYELLMQMIADTSADALLMNSTMISKIQTMARILGYKTETEEAFGKKVTTMDGVRFIDLKNHYTVADSDGNKTATANTCVPIDSTAGTTDIYAVKFDVNDGFHGATLTGNSVISQYIPDFSKPGAVKEGEVELVAATVLKNTAHAGVIRGVKIK